MKENCKCCDEQDFSGCTCNHEIKPKIVVVGDGGSEIHRALSKTKHLQNIIMESREEFVERKSIEMLPFMPYMAESLPEIYITEGKRKIKNRSKKVRNIKKQKKLSRRRNRK